MSRAPTDLREWLDRFEEAWQSGVPPRIEAFLPHTPQPSDLRVQLLEELVMIDLEYRWRQAVKPKTGSPVVAKGPRLEEYLGLHPEQGPRERLSLELVG